MVNCPKMNRKYIREVIKICRIQHFEADFLWPQNPEFRNNPEIFHPCNVDLISPDKPNCMSGKFSVLSYPSK